VDSGEPGDPPMEKLRWAVCSTGPKECEVHG